MKSTMLKMKVKFGNEVRPQLAMANAAAAARPPTTIIVAVVVVAVFRLLNFASPGDYPTTLFSAVLLLSMMIMPFSAVSSTFFHSFC